MFKPDSDPIRCALSLTLTTLLVASVVVAGVSLTTGVVSAAPTQIDDCTHVDAPGVYELTRDIGRAAAGLSEPPRVLRRGGGPPRDVAGAAFEPPIRTRRGIRYRVLSLASHLVCRSVDGTQTYLGRPKYVRTSHGTHSWSRSPRTTTLVSVVITEKHGRWPAVPVMTWNEHDPPGIGVGPFGFGLTALLDGRSADLDETGRDDSA